MPVFKLENSGIVAETARPWGSSNMSKSSISLPNIHQEHLFFNITSFFCHQVSPTPPNGSIKTTSRQSSPVKQLATLAEPEPTDPILLLDMQETETNTLLPHSKS